MSKKTLLTIIILIILLIGVTALYFYLRNFKVVDNLTYYMPQETELYIEFNLKDENLNNFYENNFRGQARFEKLIRDAKFFHDLSKDLIEQANKISLLVINYENEWHKVWILSSDNIHKFHALLPADYFESMLDSKTTALSKNRQILKMIKEIEPMVEHTSEQRKILNKFSNNNFINIYLSGAYAEFLSTRPDPTYQLILNNLDLDYEQPVFLGLSANTEDNNIIYNFYGEMQEEKDYENFSDNVETPRWGVSPGLFLEFHIANLKDIYNNLINNLIDENKKQEWSQKYEFEWDELEDLLDNSGIIFVSSKSGPVDVNEIFDLEKYNYALLIQTNLKQEKILEKIEKIKNIVKNILAFKYPVEKVKYLPDKTKSTELVADPSQFEFSAECISVSGKECRDAPVGRLIEFIEHKKHRFVIGYKNNYLIAGNSKNLIESILNKEESEEGVNCKMFTGNEVAIINSNQLVRGLLSYIDRAIINVEYDKREVVLQGCLLW